MPCWRIHRHVGMGGDQLVAALAGEDFDEEHGDDVRAAESALYLSLIPEVEPLEGSRELIEELKRSDHAVILASSAKSQELDHYLDLLDVRELADGWTDSSDVEKTKPEPDLVRAAIEKAGGQRRNPVGWRADRRLQRAGAHRGGRSCRVPLGRRAAGGALRHATRRVTSPQSTSCW